jgi:anti-anti-sigma factor
MFAMSHRHYKVSQERDVHVMELTLPIVVDPADFDKLNETIGDATDSAGGERWVVDLRQVEYVGSALLGLLVNLRQRIKTAGGRLVLCGLSDHVNKALQTCSLHNLFTITAGRDDAIKKAGSTR